MLLIGAGFSANWGGLLSKDIGSLFHGYCRNLQFENKDLLLTAETYERAWDQIMAQKDDEVRDSIVDKLVKVFEFHQRMISQNTGSGSLRHTHQTLIGLLRWEQTSNDLVVTTNQDVLLESLHFELGHGKFRLLTPGVAEAERDETNGSWRYRCRDVPGTFPTIERPERTLPLLKLHGSFDWRIDGKPIMITGVNKEPDKWPPYLMQCFDYLDDWLKDGEVDLIVIGHALADNYLVTLLKDKCNDSWRIFIIDPAHPHDWFHSKVSPMGTALMAAIKCYLPVSFREIVDQVSPPTAAYRLFDSEILRVLRDTA
ncbi:MAG: hypothetical protein M3R13_09375 [Armatimonadota bacterium]|nr:hypothetical protein [Armatimonadota bacterium]